LGRAKLAGLDDQARNSPTAPVSELHSSSTRSLIVPYLQRMGVLRQHYEASTLRGNLQA
jgi:hypothetical protein